MLLKWDHPLSNAIHVKQFHIQKPISNNSTYKNPYQISSTKLHGNSPTVQGGVRVFGTHTQNAHPHVLCCPCIRGVDLRIITSTTVNHYKTQIHALTTTFTSLTPLSLDICHLRQDSIDLITRLIPSRWTPLLFLTAHIFPALPTWYPFANHIGFRCVPWRETRRERKHGRKTRKSPPAQKAAQKEKVKRHLPKTIQC